MTHDLRLVASWLFSRDGREFRRLFIAQAVFAAAITVTLVFWNPAVSPVSEDRAKRDVHLADLFILAAPLYLFVVTFTCAIFFKAQHIRLDRMLDSEYSFQYKSRIQRQYADEYAEKVQRLYLERDEWRAKTQAQLYEMILDQVERGALKPRPEYPGDNYGYPNSA